MLCHVTQRYVDHRDRPCNEDATVGLELLQEPLIRFDNGAALPDIGQCRVQRPVLLLHGVGDHRRCRAGNAHFTVHQHSLSTLPAKHSDQGKFMQRFEGLCLTIINKIMVGNDWIPHWRCFWWLPCNVLSLHNVLLLLLLLLHAVTSTKQTGIASHFVFLSKNNIFILKLVKVPSQPKDKNRFAHSPQEFSRINFTLTCRHRWKSPLNISAMLFSVCIFCAFPTLLTRKFHYGKTC